jgi:hypothetical protein
MSAAIREAMQEAEDAKMRKKAGEAYDAADKTPPAPKKDMRDAVRGQKGYAKGGVTRGDGCVAKGHTKGKMIAMAGGKTR